MKADLYVRVSTDEQADKGYSQRDQAERLQRYCEVNKIAVRRIILKTILQRILIARNG